MATVKRQHYSIVIEAPAGKVWELMLGHESYKEWTAAFVQGSYYEGTFGLGERIRFLSPSGDGMVSEIAEWRPGEFVSIKHLGYIFGGVDDVDSEAIRAWAPAYENYTLRAVPGGTEVLVDQDVTDEYEQCMLESWPKALASLKVLCETPR